MLDNSYSFLARIGEHYKAEIRLTPQKRQELAELACRTGLLLENAPHSTKLILDVSMEWMTELIFTSTRAPSSIVRPSDWMLSEAGRREESRRRHRLQRLPAGRQVQRPVHRPQRLRQDPHLALPAKDFPGPHRDRGRFQPHQ